MSTVIKIKRTNTGSLPSSLTQGEFAYIYDTSDVSQGAGNLGKRLFLGNPNSDVDTPIKIGGEYYTNLMDHTLGTLTANAALLVDGDKKLDNLKIDNIDINGNTISSLDTNGDINLTPNGTGKTIVSNLYVGDNGTSLQEFIEDITGGATEAGTGLTVNYNDAEGSITIGIANSGVDTAQIADTAVTTAKIASQNITTALLADANVTTAKINDLAVTTGKLADGAVTTAKITDENITTGKLATGAVTNDKITDGTIANAKLANSAVTIGGTEVSLGTSITDLTSLTSLGIDNISINGNTISTTDTDGDLAVAPNGQGTITVPSGYESRTGFSERSLVNKAYVDSVAQGLDVKESVQAATTGNLDATYNNGGGTLTANTNSAIVVDGVTLSQDDRLLVKDQTDPVENGIYVVTSTGVDGSAAFLLTRAPDADAADELTGGAFFFVEQGTTQADAGFVATHVGTPTFGTTSIAFEQFSGAGQITAGAAMTKTGNTLDVVTDASTIEVNGSDELQLVDGGITNVKIAAGAAIAQSKLSLNAATTRASAAGISQANLGLVSFDSNQFTLTNGWAQVTTIDGGTYGA